VKQSLLVYYQQGLCLKQPGLVARPYPGSRESDGEPAIEDKLELADPTTANAVERERRQIRTSKESSARDTRDRPAVTGMSIHCTSGSTEAMSGHPI